QDLRQHFLIVEPRAFVGFDRALIPSVGDVAAVLIARTDGDDCRDEPLRIGSPGSAPRSDQSSTASVMIFTSSVNGFGVVVTHACASVPNRLPSMNWSHASFGYLNAAHSSSQPQ